MSTRLLKSVTFAVLAAWSVLALADTPGRVGRIAMTEGQVTIAGELGEESNAALVNWPVTSRNQLSTGPGSRTEVKIGSTAIRLDDNSALDVTELDDDSLRLHLHYGSASVRVRNEDVLRGFEMSTPHGVITLRDPGRFRVDAGRRDDTTMVNVFDGTAVVEGGGSRLIVRAGRRAEMGADDVRTGQAMRDSFDDWAMLRDERDDRSQSIRYVTREMTGYEDLDQNGVWQDDAEYGPLWSPRRVPVGWAPYRDGRWTYLQPWGWTWVDNAPWGYAPFHYGRWVTVNGRWCWAPGRNISRVVWSPALVGWVGGSGWNVSFTHRAAPATGWYPLAPRDAYVPNYRMSHDNLRYVNRHASDAQPDVRNRGGRAHDGRGHDGRGRGDNRRLGLTVVPHEQFSQRGTIAVKGPLTAAINKVVLQNAPPAVAPPTPLAMRDRNNDGRPDTNPGRRERNGDGRISLTERGAVPAAAGGAGFAAVPVTSAARPAPMAPSFGSEPVIRREGRFANEDLRRDSRIRYEGTRPAPRTERQAIAPAAAPLQPASATPAPVLVVQPAPTVTPVPQPRDERFRAEREAERERLRDARDVRDVRMRDPDYERERRVRGMESYQQQQQGPRPMGQVVQQVQQQVQQAPPQRMSPPPIPMAQPQQRMSPPPAPMAQPQRMSPPPAPMAQPQQRNDTAREERRKLREEANDRR